VPEIALTAAMVDRFRSRFGDDVAVLHSGMGEGERFDEWSRVHEGRARIVIGARSAVFAPLTELGLVVVDEEHDGSYKQDEAPRYHGRDAALLRAARAGAVAVLGSATPSLEALRNVALGKLTRLALPERVQARPLPPVALLDLRTTPRQAGAHFFTAPLVEALRETLARKEQALLFLNRRGYASLARCGACGEVVLCALCSIALTYHRAEQRLLCHRCEFSQPLPETCPACGAAELAIVGLGTERIEQDVAMMFPQARVLRMDSDTLRRRGELERMMEAIRARRYDLVIGTQVLSKGHDFPYITLVGAVLADVSLNIPDFRAPERTFQILTQMAGRAGRGDRPGRVLIQTYNPAHYALVHVRGHDTAAFAAEEMALRERSGSPPYASQTLVWVSATEAPAAERLAGKLAGRLRKAAERVGGVRVLGAAEAPIRRLAGRYRWMIALRAAAVGPIHRVLRGVLDDPDLRLGAHERIAVDVDAYNLL
jgi:primosomal protein N' (replication factor Y) (superfamily II helicase)